MKYSIFILFFIGITLSGILFIENVEASETLRFSDYLKLIVDGQIELIYQNNALIKQQQMIIDQIQLTNILLKGDKDIFVSGVTDRYKLMQWDSSSSCVYYDKLLHVEKSNITCPEIGLTKDQFNEKYTLGIPEN